MKQRLVKTINEDKKVGRYEDRQENVNRLSSYPLIFLPSILFVLLIIFFTANPAFCAPISIKQTAVKFLFAMGGVALSSFIIFAGLTVYNKIFVKKSKADEDDDLSTPNSIDDAVVFFIKKNKLR